MDAPAQTRHCATCGYDLAGVEQAVCPECGTAPPRIVRPKVKVPVTWSTWRTTVFAIAAHAPFVIPALLYGRSHNSRLAELLLLAAFPGAAALLSMLVGLPLALAARRNADPARTERLRWWSQQIMANVLTGSYAVVLLGCLTAALFDHLRTP